MPGTMRKERLVECRQNVVLALDVVEVLDCSGEGKPLESAAPRSTYTHAVVQQIENLGSSQM